MTEDIDEKFHINSMLLYQQFKRFIDKGRIFLAFSEEKNCSFIILSVDISKFFFQQIRTRFSIHLWYRNCYFFWEIFKELFFSHCTKLACVQKHARILLYHSYLRLPITIDLKPNLSFVPFPELKLRSLILLNVVHITAIWVTMWVF